MDGVTPVRRARVRLMRPTEALRAREVLLRLLDPNLVLHQEALYCEAAAAGFAFAVVSITEGTEEFIASSLVTPVPGQRAMFEAGNAWVRDDWRQCGLHTLLIDLRAAAVQLASPGARLFAAVDVLRNPASFRNLQRAGFRPCAPPPGVFELCMGCCKATAAGCCSTFLEQHAVARIRTATRVLRYSKQELRIGRTGTFLLELEIPWLEDEKARASLRQLLGRG
jgi:hypothetical protein